MTRHPSDTEAASVITFILIDELIQTLLNKGVLSVADATGLVERGISAAKVTPLHAARRGIPYLEEMLQEYRKHAG
jgi:hypothetical protein